MKLAGREIVLGVTGGIAAYKSAELVSRLRHLGDLFRRLLSRRFQQIRLLQTPSRRWNTGMWNMSRWRNWLRSL